MKQYPTIPTKLYPDLAVIGFDKLDGSNIRAEWNAKAGRFTRFGSRNRLLEEDHPHLGEAIPLIREHFEADFTRICREAGFPGATAFFEYFGERSFAGLHEADDPKRVVLIDVLIDRRGQIEPEEFLRLFGDLEVPRVVHRGPVDAELEERIRAGDLPGVTFEGVVFKGRGGKKGGKPIMFKVKSRAWLERLREHCAGDEALFEKLK